MQRAWIRENAILLLYAFIFFIVTFPLVLHFSTHIVGEPHSDAPIFLWNVWEMQQQLMHHRLSWWTNDILFPNRSSLLWHTYTPFYSLAVLGVNLLTHHFVFSFNAVFLLSSVAAAYCAYRFFFLHVAHRGAAVIGGALFAFQSLWSVYVQFGTQNILSIWMIAAALWCAALYAKTHRSYAAVLCGALLGLAWIQDLYLFAMSVLGVAVYSICAAGILHLLPWKKFFISLLLICIGFVVVGGWKVVDVIDQWNPTDIAVPSVAAVDFYHADIVNLLRPTSFHPLFSSASTWFTSRAQTQGSAFIGFGSIAVLVCTIVVHRRTRAPLPHRRLLIVFVIGAGVAFLYASGPFLHIFGVASHLPLPYDLLQWAVPSARHLRVVLRWLLLFHLFFAGIITIGIVYCAAAMQTLTRRVASSILLLIIIVDAAYLPRPLIAISDHSVDGYRAIAASTANGSVLTLPLEISSGYETLGSRTHSELARQLIHQRPLVGGHLSRLPRSVFDRAQTDPVLSFFLSPDAPPTDAARDPAAITQFISIYNVRFITLEKNNSDLNVDSSHSLRSYITERLHAHEFYDDEFVSVYLLTR